MQEKRIVGIFWVCDDGKKLDIIYDTEEYSTDYVSDLGDEFVIYEKQHSEVWGKLKRKFFDGKYAAYEFGDFPRGRVTFDSEDKVYIVDCDPKLKRGLSAIKVELEKIFPFDGGSVTFRSAPHLKSVRGIFNKK